MMVQLMLFFRREVVVNNVAFELEASEFTRPRLEYLSTCRLDDERLDCTNAFDRKLVDMALEPRTEPAAKTQYINRWECLDLGFKVSAEFVNADWHCPLSRVSSALPAWLQNM